MLSFKLLAGPLLLLFQYDPDHLIPKHTLIIISVRGGTN